MDGNQPDYDHIFTELLEGRIPDSAPGTDPEAYAKVLIEAIRVHEDRMHEADEEISFCQNMLSWYQSYIDDELSQGEEPWDDFQMYADQMPDEIAFHTERFLAARSMKESCESELLSLLDKHPGLNERI